MSETTIGACPVCGGEGRVFFNDNGENHVWCGDWNCMSGPFRKTEADAIAAWNRLSGLAAEVARQAARIAELEAERRELITAIQRTGTYARSLEVSGDD
jgi:ssDNA-binding Zn-finger/Zn-ribbon topoisomerase 1